jgi:hypothetical protein
MLLGVGGNLGIYGLIRTNAYKYSSGKQAFVEEFWKFYLGIIATQQEYNQKPPGCCLLSPGNP